MTRPLDDLKTARALVAKMDAWPEGIVTAGSLTDRDSAEYSAIALVRSPALLAELEEVERLREWNRILALLSEESDAKAEAAEARLAAAEADAGRWRDLLRDCAAGVNPCLRDDLCDWMAGQGIDWRAAFAAMGAP